MYEGSTCCKVQMTKALKILKYIGLFLLCVVGAAIAYPIAVVACAISYTPILLFEKFDK